MVRKGYHPVTPSALIGKGGGHGVDLLDQTGVAFLYTSFPLGFFWDASESVLRLRLNALLPTKPRLTSWGIPAQNPLH